MKVDQELLKLLVFGNRWNVSDVTNYTQANIVWYKEYNQLQSRQMDPPNAADPVERYEGIEER